MASVMAPPKEKQAISATKLLIDNRWVASESGKTFATVNPATGEEICRSRKMMLPTWTRLSRQPVRHSNMDPGEKRWRRSAGGCSTGWLI